MSDQAFEIIDKVAAIMERDGGLFLFLVIWSVSFFWLGRLFIRFKDAGQERMGLYLIGVAEHWLLAAAATVTIWWKVLFGNMQFWELKAELWLDAPYWPETIVYWCAGLVLGMVAIAIMFVGIEKIMAIRPTRMRLLMYPRTTSETVVWSLVVSPTAGFCEEVIFRAVILWTLADMTNDIWLSVALSSVLFGLMHAYQGLVWVLATMAMGGILAMSVIYAGSLWPAIIAHTLYNMAVPLLSRTDLIAEYDAMA